MKVLVYAAFYLPGYKGGGPIKTIANLVESSSEEIDYYIVTRDRDLGDDTPYHGVCVNEWTKCKNASVFYCSSGYVGLIRGWLELLRREYDVVYLNSYFSLGFSFVPLLLAKIKKRKLVLAPRGEFSPGALRLKSRKKSLFIRFFKMCSLYDSVVFQASNCFEARDIEHALGSDVEIYVAENVGNLKVCDTVKDKCSTSIKLVFLSRISAKKNLLYALEALKKVEVPVVFDVYGPLEDCDYWGRCLDAVDSLPSNVSFNYNGELHPSEVLSTLACYDLFFFPTEGENYGHVIAEAICSGLPLLISDQTPWRDLESHGIGWSIPLSKIEKFTDAIQVAHDMSVEEYSEFRRRVQVWAGERFDNAKAVDENMAMFEYALKK